MTSLNNIPQNLEINSWLKLSLNSTNEVDRQIALEEIIASGFSPELEEDLKNTANNDVSQNCRNQAAWILKLAETKPQLKSLIKHLDIGPDYVALQIQKGDYAKVYLCSQILRKSPSESTLNAWRETLQKSNDSRLIETGLNILAKFGNTTDTPIALRHLQSTNSQVICAAFSFLAQKDGDSLKKYIKYGLSSKTASVMLHSIHLLRTIDEPEAIKYLSNLILNKNALVRQKALRELLLIDFKKIQDFFWQYLGREDQPLLLVKAGFIVTINPNARFPFKIYDILSNSSGIKQHILQLILKQSLNTTQAAGILKEKNFNDFITEIQQYINNKKTEQLIRIAANNLRASEVSLRLSAVEYLSQYISHAQIKTLLENQLKNETDSEIKSILISLFEENQDSTNNQNELAINQSGITEQTKVIDAESSKEPTANNKEQEFPTVKEFINLDNKKQRSYINKINSTEDYNKVKKTILEAVSYELSKSTTLDILKKISSYGFLEDAKHIYHLTKSRDKSIIAQTIRTIGAIHIDMITTDINRFMSNDDPRIKSATFDVYIKADKSAAVQYVSTMLKHTSISIRRIGLSLLPQLDYPSAEPLLWWSLNHETYPELLEQTGYMIAANPTQEGISRLYDFTHEKTGEVKEEYKDIWELALSTSVQVFEISAEQIEQDCFNIFQTERNKEEDKEANYKYQSVMKEKEEEAAELESKKVLANATPLESVVLFFKKYKVPCGITVGFIAIMTIYTLLQPDPNKVYRANPHEVAAENNFIPTQESDKKTQVGDDEWQGYQVSNAGKILKSPKYAALMQSAAKEVEDYRKEAEIKEKEYFTKLANDPSADKDDREWAAAQLYADYRKASDAYAAQNYVEAEKYYEKVVKDNSLKGYGRLDAIQKLCEITSIRGDKENWNKWLDVLLKEIKTTMPEFSKVEAFDNFGEKMKQAEEVAARVRSDPALAEQMKKSLRENYRMSEQEAEQAVKDFSNFKHPFEAMKMEGESHRRQHSDMH